MKIKTRLKLNALFSLAVVMLMMLSVVLLFLDLDKANQNANLIEEMRKNGFERISLRDDYILYREERSSIQWTAKSEILRGLIEKASERLTGPTDKALLQEVKKNFEMTFTTFSTILEKDKREKRNRENGFAVDEMESRLIGQIFLKSYAMMDSIGRLHEETARAVIRIRTRGIALIVFCVLTGALVIIINSMAINRIVARRLTTLNKGVAIIGSGNLEHQIDSKGDDELADLARANNEMAARLKQSYTSIENLEEEVNGRKRAIENMVALSLHQQALITSIPDIVMEVDANKIYTWANTPGIEFFGKDVIGKEADFYFVREQNTYEVVQPIFNGEDDVIYLESWQRRKDGQERLLAWWCRVLKDVDGNVTGVLSSAHDITERKLAEEETKKLNEELEKRVAERTAELRARTFELERINKVFVDRELRMREMKARITELERKT
jgi:PAS domain S-box-containing protein